MTEEFLPGSTRAGGAPADEYAVVLPCSPNEFRNFLSGLFGKPQAISCVFLGTFVITSQDIEAFYHLVTQRIEQQNDATTLNFTVRIVFDDNSSVLLNSFEDFVRYNEVRPVASIAVHLSWAVLIRFRDKPIPEKQEIEVSLVTSNSSPLPLFDDTLVYRFRASTRSYIGLHIHHTARTWGADIQALLSNHIKTLLKPESKVKDFIAMHSELLGFVAGLAILTAALIGAVLATRRFAAAQMAALSPLETATIDARVAFLMQTIAAAPWQQFLSYLQIYLGVSLTLQRLALE